MYSKQEFISVLKNIRHKDENLIKELKEIFENEYNILTNNLVLTEDEAKYKRLQGMAQYVKTIISHINEVM